MTKQEAYNKLIEHLNPMMKFCDDMNYDFSKRDILECVKALNNTDLDKVLSDKNKQIEVLEKQRKMSVQSTNRSYVLESKVIYLTNVIDYISKYKDFSILLND